MSRNPQTQKLISIVEPVCEAAGYELVDLRLLMEQGGWVLRVCIDLPHPTGERSADDIQEVPAERVDLEDCENMSRELSAVLDVDDPIPQAYTLEVSSPGIDRPLRTAAHFAYFAGSDAKIQLSHGLPMPNAPERKNFRGVLKGITDDGSKLAIECDGQRFELAIDDVEQAKLVPDWDAVMSGKSGVGGRLPKPIKPGHRPSKKKSQSGQSPKKGGSDAHD
jgi:ribosome maturation factor RimP